VTPRKMSRWAGSSMDHQLHANFATGMGGAPRQ
jgi:hypothetical protein